MYERISLKLVELFSMLQREEGQGATEYAMVIGFLVVTLTLGLGLLGVGINDSWAGRRQAQRAGPVERPGSGRIEVRHAFVGPRFTGVVLTEE